jgi:hypothetical protein
VAHKESCDDGHCDEPLCKEAMAEIARARREARAFFQTLFPGEEPLSD